MGWFEEQIRERIKNDDEAFSEAFETMRNSVTGKPLFSVHANSSDKAAKTAINEILFYYNIKPRDIPKRITELDDRLEYLTRSSGIMRRSIKLTGKWYKDASGVILAELKNGDMAALIPYRTGYYYSDYKSGAKIRVTKENAAEFTGSAYCFYKPMPLKAMNKWAFFKFVLRSVDKRIAFSAAAAVFAAAVIAMLLPAINSIIFNNIILSDTVSALVAVAILLLCVTLSRWILSAVKIKLLSKLRLKLKLDVEASVMMRLLSLPSAFFKKYSPGDLSGRIMNIGKLCELLCDSVFSAAITALFSLIYLIQIYKYTPKLLLPSVIVMLTVTIVSAAVYYVKAKETKERMEKSSSERGLLFSVISGIQKIKLSGAERRAFAKWARRYSESAALKYSPSFISRFGGVMAAAVPLIGTAWIYYIAFKSGISAAGYMTFNAAYAMLAAAFSDVYNETVKACEISPLISMAEPVIAETPEISGEKTVVTTLSGAIELNNVSFRYSEEMPWIIDNLSLKIRSGQYVAVVGTTGCGKSTFMRLLLGFELPQKGAIYYDGKDLKTLDMRSLRKKMGVVLQDGKLFAGDIYSNITVSNPSLTVDEAWQAAETAGIAEDIRAMPMGMNTLVTDGGGGISGGQRQRLLIARAVAAKPKILMFDEATSALDNVAQRQVSESLAALKCTRIVIAHRLSTIKDCGRIIVLDNGKIVEDGTYEQLLQKGGVFSELVKRQQV